MATLKYTLRPQSAFATPFHGDTLFGQLCWAILRSLGEDSLKNLLATYKEKPFVVISDAFPKGYLPKPHLPQHMLIHGTLEAKDRKDFKRNQWIPVQATKQAIATWMLEAKSDAEILNEISSTNQVDKKISEDQIGELLTWNSRMHNSINRMTGTTGDAGFAPYSVQELWFAANIDWEFYVVIDEEQFQQQQLTNLLKTIGQSGYGKDASTGAGKFQIINECIANLPHHPNANALLALSAIAPQGLEIKSEHCFYQPFTRFGRHGDWAVLVNPYKAPILMAKTGAVLSPLQNKLFEYFGQALGGKGEISRTIPATVHQGYAPVLRIALNE